MIWITLAACSPQELAPPGPDELGFLTSFGARNDDQVGGVAILEDGGAVVAMVRANPSLPDLIVTRLDADGMPLWEDIWKRPFAEEVHAVVIEGSRARVAAGVWDRTDPVTVDISAAVVDFDLQTGQVEETPWEWNPSGERDRTTDLIGQGDTVLAVGWAGPDGMLARVGDNGDWVDRTVWDTGLREEIEAGTVVGDRLYVTGRTKDELEQDDWGQLVVASFDTADLSLEWTLSWGEGYRARDVGHGIAAVGTVLVVVGENGFGDAVVLGVDLSGDLLWEDLYDSGGEDVARQVVMEPEGTALVAIDADGSTLLRRIDPANGSVLDELVLDGIRRITNDLKVSDTLACLGGAEEGGVDNALQAVAFCLDRVTLTLPTRG